MLNEFMKKSWLALVSALCFGLLVSAVNMALAGKIKQNKIDKRDGMLEKLFGQDCSFEGVKAEGAAEDAEPIYFVAKKGGQVDGYALIWTGPGFAENIDLLVGFNAGLDMLKGFAVMKSAETPGFGDQITLEDKEGKYRPDLYYKDRFINKPIDKVLVRADDNIADKHLKDEQVVTISGSTVTSEAVIVIVNGAKKQMVKLLNK
ncbi:MAG: FMN-binding protein [Phycisphaerae bacterium]|nr:FMN-binding protein [Phycisphaerae bacterium]